VTDAVLLKYQEYWEIGTLEITIAGPARGTGKLIEGSGGRDFWGDAVPSCGKTDRGAAQSGHCTDVSK
jgi:hypothetical protein